MKWNKIILLSIALLAAKTTFAQLDIDSLIKTQKGVWCSEIKISTENWTNTVLNSGKHIYIIDKTIDSLDAMWYNWLLQDSQTTAELLEKELPHAYGDFVSQMLEKDSGIYLRFVGCHSVPEGINKMAKMLFKLLPTQIKSPDSIFFDAVKSAYVKSTSKISVGFYHPSFSHSDLMSLKKYYDTAKTRILATYGPNATYVKQIMNWIYIGYNIRYKDNEFDLFSNKVLSQKVKQIISSDEHAFVIAECPVLAIAKKPLPNVQNYQFETISQYWKRTEPNVPMATLLSLETVNTEIETLNTYAKSIAESINNIMENPTNPLFITHAQQLTSISQLINAKEQNDYFDFVDNSFEQELTNIDFEPLQENELKENVKKKPSFYKDYGGIYVDFLQDIVFTKNKQNKVTNSMNTGFQVGYFLSNSALLYGYVRGTINGYDWQQHQLQFAAGNFIHKNILLFFNFPMAYNRLHAYTDTSLLLINTPVNNVIDNKTVLLTQKSYQMGLEFQLWLVPNNNVVSLKLSANYMFKPFGKGNFMDKDKNKYNFEHQLSTQTLVKLSVGLQLAQ